MAWSRWLDPLLWLLVALAIAWGVEIHRAGPATSRRARITRALGWLTWGAVWLMSTPACVGLPVRWLEPPANDAAAVADVARADRTAIVVLGAGRKTDMLAAPPRERLNAAGLGRILGAARLYAARPVGLVVISAGPPLEAEAMLDAAVHFGIPRERVAIEDSSRNTRENAIETAGILRARGVERVVLVTSALHMRRSVGEFTRAGVTVVPAPVDFLSHQALTLRDFFPEADATASSAHVVHELLGFLRP